jgi:hypothetical protein
MNKIFWLIVLLIVLPGLTGCDGNGQDKPGAAVETYLQAITTGDQDRIAAVSCAAWEETARGEVASFAGVKTRLNGLECLSRSTNGDEEVVDCKGEIVATYNDEDSSFSLEGRAYRVVREAGEWFVCGYGE